MWPSDTERDLTARVSRIRQAYREEATVSGMPRPPHRYSRRHFLHNAQLAPVRLRRAVETPVDLKPTPHRLYVLDAALSTPPRARFYPQRNLGWRLDSTSINGTIRDLVTSRLAHRNRRHHPPHPHPRAQHAHTPRPAMTTTTPTPTAKSSASTPKANPPKPSPTN